MEAPLQRTQRLSIGVVWLLSLTACPPDDGSADASATVDAARADASFVADAGPPPTFDAGPRDAGSPTFDSGPRDAGPVDSGPTDAGVPPAPTVDTVVAVGPDESYGTRTFDVPALANWVNSGVYLRTGQSASITASGTWRVSGTTSYGPAGGSPSSLERGCVVGSLVARVELTYKDTALACVGTSGSITATRDGVLYVGSIVSTDLGETYETRRNASGSLRVTVSAGTAVTTPTIAAADVAAYPLERVRGGAVELLGSNVRVVVPIATAMRDRATARAALARLDAIYAHHEALRGAAPYGGQRIRFVADPGITGIGYMLAGNPIRMDAALVSGSDSARITRAGETGAANWGFAHELGHDFTFVNGTWIYMPGGTLEGWPNVFSVHALRAIGHPDGARETCEDRDAYLASGTYEDLRDDPWLTLCFLLELQSEHGWELYESFFDALNDVSNSEVPYDGDDDAPTWGFVRDLMSDAAGEDLTPSFERWRLPLP